MPVAIEHKDIGDVWTPQATFTVGGTPTDPTAMTVKVRNPAGTIITYTVSNPLSPPAGITRVSAGIFKLSEPLTAAGYWYANFTGTGAATASEDHEVRVDPSPFTANAGLSTRALVGLGETKAWLESNKADTTDDLIIVDLINAASTAIHNLAGREFKARGTQPQVRTFDAFGNMLGHIRTVDGDVVGSFGSYHVLDIGDLSAFTSATYDINDGVTSPVSIASLDITPLPRNREEWEPYTRLRFRSTIPLGYGYLINVTGTWGFPAVPEDIKQACRDTVAYWLDRDVEHYRQDLAPQEGESGNTVIVGNMQQRILSLPPQVFAVVNSYRNFVLA